MEGAQVRVDLTLGVADADVEDPADVVENDEPLAVLHRDLRETTAAQERAETRRRPDGAVPPVIRLVTGSPIPRDLLRPRDGKGPRPALVRGEPPRLESGQRLEHPTFPQARGRDD